MPMTSVVLTSSWQAVASGSSRVSVQAQESAEVWIGTVAPGAGARGFMLADQNNSFSDDAFAGQTLYARAIGRGGHVIVVYTTA